MNYLKMNKMTEEEAVRISEWKYSDVYEMYNLPNWDRMVEKGFSMTTDMGRSNFLTFYDSDSLVGFVNLNEKTEYVFLGIGVNPDCVGKGYGSAIMEMAVAKSQRRFGDKKIRLEVRSWNERAIKCYLNSGFKVTGTITQTTYIGPGEFTQMEYNHECKVVSKYSDEWPKRFAIIEGILKDNLKTFVGIEHVGSTSIPGLDAKPVIDIDIVIDSRSDLPAIIEELSQLGYSHCGDQGIPGREVFKRVGDMDSALDQITHHLYVCDKNSSEYRRHLAFRDKLRNDDSLRDEYQRIKYEILDQVGSTNRAAYVEMKANNYRDFFESIIGDLSNE